MSDYDKQQWQTEQAARDAALEKQRETERKTRERSARNAQRKLERLHRTLKDQGEISEFEDEFAESVSERLDKFGSASQDREKGRPGDALSFAQKRVVAAMNRKVKDLKKQPLAEGARGNDAGLDELERPRFNTSKPRSSFKSKTPSFTPRVRQLDDDFDAATDSGEPQWKAPEREPERRPEPEPTRPPVGKPFLRIVSNNG
jgi:Rad3-related DNA helicase